jgi:transposase-like protein
MTALPKTLIDAVAYFSDEEKAVEFMAALRWPNGPCCPQCGSVDVKYISTRRVWQCKDCENKKQFSVRVGTIFEDSKLPMGKLLVAVWMIVNAKNGISSHELARSLGITQKSAWHLSHRIRLALHVGSFDRQLAGRVEADETFIGGRARNMHAGKRKMKGRGAVGKAVVFGLLERHGEVRTIVVSNTKRRTLHPEIQSHVAPGTNVLTDAHKSYLGLPPEYVHEFIDHAECYAKGHVHTNGLENFWSLLKRCVHGTYVAIEPFHLFRYLDEQSFRFNQRKTSDTERFAKAIQGTGGKRLRYNTLIGKDTEDCSASGSVEESVEEKE